MRATLHGRVDGSSVVIVGSWDPFLPAHRTMLEQLRSHARQRALASLAVMLDPSPAVFIWGRHDWAIFDDVRTRIELLLGCGIDGVLLIRLLRRDVAATAAEFFSTMLAQIDIAELWLGAHQTLGTGDHGRTEAIEDLAEDNGIELVRLPPLRRETEDVRQLLAAGRVREATQIVGRSPVRGQPRSLALRLAWLPGRYQAIPLDRPTAPPEQPSLIVELVPQAKGLPRLQWPDREVRYLAFAAGPADHAGEL